MTKIIDPPKNVNRKAVILAKKIVGLADGSLLDGETLSYVSLAGSWPADFERGPIPVTYTDRDSYVDRVGITPTGLAALRLANEKLPPGWLLPISIDQSATR
jgi:hypothetical protein